MPKMPGSSRDGHESTGTGAASGQGEDDRTADRRRRHPRAQEKATAKEPHSHREKIRMGNRLPLCCTTEGAAATIGLVAVTGWVICSIRNDIDGAEMGVAILDPMYRPVVTSREN